MFHINNNSGDRVQLSPGCNTPFLAITFHCRKKACCWIMHHHDAVCHMNFDCNHVNIIKEIFKNAILDNIQNIFIYVKKDCKAHGREIVNIKLS